MYRSDGGQCKLLLHHNHLSFGKLRKGIRFLPFRLAQGRNGHQSQHQLGRGTRRPFHACHDKRECPLSASLFISLGNRILPRGFAPKRARNLTILKVSALSCSIVFPQKKPGARSDRTPGCGKKQSGLRVRAISPWRRRSGRRRLSSSPHSTMRRCSRGGGFGSGGSRRVPTHRGPAPAHRRIRRCLCP
jgi:hypothetical protein